MPIKPLTWKEKSERIIAPIVAEARRNEWTVKELKKAIRDAWPGGVRECYPYKAWCFVQRRALIEYEHPTPPVVVPQQEMLFDGLFADVL